MLVVDDNIDAAESLGVCLSVIGHSVLTAHSENTALEIAHVFVPEVELLDIGLPGLDGNEKAKRLRRIPGLDTALLIAITGWGAEDDRRRSEEAGFNCHLTKPVDPERLRAILADASVSC